jgi:hypothetical protein
MVSIRKPAPRCRCFILARSNGMSISVGATMGVYIIGLTVIGRATVETLKMNNEFIVPARRHWVEAGWHPPQSQVSEDARD